MLNFVLFSYMMRNLIRHIFSYLMILVILTATLQVSVTKMTCLMSGKIAYSIEKAEDCAPIKKGNNVGRKCCDFHKVTLNYQTISTIDSFHLDVSKHFLNCIFITPTILEQIKVNPILSFFHNLPPPKLLGGIDLLKLIQVFRL